MFPCPNGLTRRTYLGSSLAALVGVGLGFKSQVSASDGVTLPADHVLTVRKRQRRIVVQHDVHDVLMGYAKKHGTDAPFQPFRDAVFAYIDDPQSQIDAVWLDAMGVTVGSVYPSEVLPPVDFSMLQNWLARGTDWIAELVSGARQRKLEVFWNHRISDVDGKPEGGLEMEHLHPLKAAHPDWVIPVKFWWQGMWNLAAPGLREYKIRALRELVQKYPLDGVQIDFSRHIPCLPPGRQWELRGEVTEFMRMVRTMCLDEAAQRGRPILVAAKVPETLAGCQVDGFDIAAWAQLSLVDILTLGSRTMDVEVERFREVVGDAIQLQPCFDDHHATDGYRHLPIEGLRGVFANHWQRGANSVVTFNWGTGRPELCAEIGCEVGSSDQAEAYREVGSPATLAGKNKVFAVERRGGYPWAEGYFNRNDNAPLPAAMTDRPLPLPIHISDAPAKDSALTIRAILWGIQESQEIEVKINGEVLPITRRDSAWKDPQIFSPKPQPTSGGAGNYKVDPQQRLLLVECATATWKQGRNELSIELRSSSKEGDGIPSRVQLEKLEAHLHYGT